MDDDVPNGFADYVAERDEALKPPRRPCPSQMPTNEWLKALARGGQAAALVDALSSRWMSCVETANEKKRLLDEVLKANADKGLPVLIDAVFRCMIEYDARLLLTRQLLIAEKMAQYNGLEDATLRPSPAVIEELGKLLRMEMRLVDLCERYARISHVLKLAGYRPVLQPQNVAPPAPYRPPAPETRDSQPPSRCAPEVTVARNSMPNRPARPVSAPVWTPA
ncbi:MAG: hypothetical protein HS116_21020 [Planctomycetes bacterium]|nr:hypothetical protein [Planctomycetota bacterium]